MGHCGFNTCTCGTYCCELHKNIELGQKYVKKKTNKKPQTCFSAGWFGLCFSWSTVCFLPGGEQQSFSKQICADGFKLSPSDSSNLRTLLLREEAAGGTEPHGATRVRGRLSGTCRRRRVTRRMERERDARRARSRLGRTDEACPRPPDRKSVV